MGTTRPPGPGQGAGKGAVPPAGRAPQPVRCPPRPGPDARRLRRAPRSRGEAPPAPRLAPDGRWPRPPPSSQRKVQCGREAVGLRSTGRAPTFGAGRHPPRALAGRSARENHRGDKAGHSGGWLQDGVRGSSCTAKRTLPYRPGLFGKLPRRRRGAARYPHPLSPRLAGGRSKHICWALAEIL